VFDRLDGLRGGDRASWPAAGLGVVRILGVVWGFALRWWRCLGMLVCLP